MTAEIVPDPGATRPWVGWCEQCQDGVRHNARTRAQRWVDEHNEAAHRVASTFLGEK